MKTKSSSEAQKPVPRTLHVIETVIPGVRMIRTYQRRWLRADLVAGVTIFAMLVPQGMAYGELAGVAPVAGLYTAIGALVGYALFGSSRRLMIGPEASSAILVAATLAPVAAGSDAATYAMLASVLALLVGGIALLAGLIRVGFIADFVSRPILLGYIIGASFIIIASQLGKLFGIKITADEFFQKIWSVITNIDQTSWLTLGIGLFLIAFLLLLRRFAPKVPGGIVVVVGMTLLSALTHLDQHGIAVVGQIPAGLPHPAIPHVTLSDVLNLVLPASALTLIVFTDVALTARLFAEKHDEKADANRELIGLGAANITAGLIQGFPVAASQSRTVVNDETGGKTQVVGIIAAICLLIFLLWFTPLLASLPQVALAAIIIAAAVNLINFKPLLEVYRVRPIEFFLALITLVGVLSIGVLYGILVAVVLALLVVISRISRPHDAVLGSVEGIDGYHDIDENESLETVPGLIAYRFDAPLFFANADFFLTHARELIAASDPPVEWFLMNAEAIIDIDVTAAAALKKLQSELERKGIVLAMARTSHPLRRMLKRSGLTDLIGQDHIFPTVSVAVQTFLESKGELAGKSSE
ncbi:MAG TPA: sulfate permease [Ktedonobacteraceae bacterium]